MSAPSGLPRLLRGIGSDGTALTLREHVAVHGPLPQGAKRGADEDLIETVRRSGLCGRGGAAFPTGTKLASVAKGRGKRVVVVNGSEGEPVSGKDHLLLSRCPHLVLDGAVAAARSVGASRIVVAAKAPAAGSMEAAVEERAAYAVDPIVPEVMTVPGRFIAGEESALVSYLNGGPGLPTFVPPRPYEKGVGGKPTLVSNAETLAHLALIARFGDAWFREIGTASEPGSTLVSLSGAVGRPGVYEVARGAPLGDVIEQAGGPARPLQAFLIGGYAGAWVDARRAWSAPLSTQGLAPLGGVLAAGVVAAFPKDACGVAETARIASYLASESAGQCGPCVNGLNAIASAIAELARGTARRDVVERLGNWAWQVTGRGACHHPDGAARMIASALRTFWADVAEHRDHRPCAHALTSYGAGVASGVTAPIPPVTAR